MDPIPTFPTDANLETFRDFVNVQKEMNEHLLAERRLYEQIGKISLDVESRVVQRRQHEFNLMKQIRDKVLEVNRLVERRATTIGTEREELERVIKATKEEIDFKQKLITLSREASQMEMEMTKKIHDENTRWFHFTMSQLQKITGFKSDELAMSKSIGEEIMKTGRVTESWAYSLGAMLVMLKGAFDLFKKFDTAAWEFRKAMGAIRDQVDDIRKQAQRMAIDFMDIGVTIDGAYKSFQALGRVMGGVHNVSQGLSETVAILAAQLGVSEEHSAGALRNLAAISKHTMETQQSMLYIAQSMSAAAGVPLNDVMKDVASRSNTTLTMMSRLPNVALKSSIELRRMGSSLDQSAKASRHLLDFTENIQEEMEASVLLGRSINLQKARELAYHRDIEGSTKEILRISKSISFEKLDPFQQEAFARATGRSVDELLNLLQTDRQIEKVKRSGTQAQKEQLAIYEKMRTENVATAKANAQNVEAIIRTKANQERLVAIQNKWNQLLAKAQEFLLPVIDNLLTGVLALTQWAPQLMAITGTVGTLFSWFSKIDFIVDKVGFSIMQWSLAGFKSLTFGQKLLAIFGKIPIVGRVVTGLISIISKSFGFLGKFFGFFGKWLGPIGWVITAFQAISGFIKGWNSSTGGFIDKLKGGLLGALRGVIPFFDQIVAGVKWLWHKVQPIGAMLFKWAFPINLVVEGLKTVAVWLLKVQQKLTGAFSSAWDKVKKIWGGHSPSQVGLSILKGITSIGPMLVQAIINPFKMGFDFLMKHVPGLGKIIEKTTSALFHKPIEAKAQATYIPAVTVTPQGTKIETTSKTSSGAKTEKDSNVNPMSEETGQKIVSLLERILAKDTNIHMDGQLLSSALARQTEFRGGYGVNKVA